MKKFLNDNKWNILAVASFIFTLLFGIYGIFFVPSYVNDVRKVIYENANKELVSDLKEIVYSDFKTDSNLINALMEAKELKFGIRFQKTNELVLNQVKESFMGDKFIPLQDRFVLFARIDSLKTVSPKNDIQYAKASYATSSFDYITYSLSIISLVISGFLLLGLFLRNRKNDQGEAADLPKYTEEVVPEKYYSFDQIGLELTDIFYQLGISYETSSKRSPPFLCQVTLDNSTYGVYILMKCDLKSLIEFKSIYDSEKHYSSILIFKDHLYIDQHDMLSKFQRDNPDIVHTLHWFDMSNRAKLINSLSLLLKDNYTQSGKMFEVVVPKDSINS